MLKGCLILMLFVFWLTLFFFVDFRCAEGIPDTILIGLEFFGLALFFFCGFQVC